METFGEGIEASLVRYGNENLALRLTCLVDLKILEEEK
jgi:hypothetical protein